MVTSHCWNELYDFQVYGDCPTDGKIVAACSNQGHLFAAYCDVTQEVPGDVILKERFLGKSFCDVVVT